MPDRLACPLCRAGDPRRFATVRMRRYFECASCRLVFLSPGQRLGPAAEQAHYATHENDPADLRYRAFLNRLCAPLVERIAGGAEGLDYGCGPGPTLSVMLAARGFAMSLYDPYFAPDGEALRRSYDFIACTEVVEHFRSPGDEFDRLNRLLRPGGWLGVMTEMLCEDRAFESWHYVRDPTHVCFYRLDTMRWIARRYGWALEVPHPNVALFRKPASAAPEQGTELG